MLKKVEECMSESTDKWYAIGENNKWVEVSQISTTPEPELTAIDLAEMYLGVVEAERIINHVS